MENTINKLVNYTYDEIFFENLHLLLKDSDEIKNIILKNIELLNNNLDKYLFIKEFSEKIKKEKIEEIEIQKRDYGQILMKNHIEIITLYNWLNTFDLKEKIIIKTENIIFLNENFLNKVSEELFKQKFIDDEADFKNLFLNEESNKKSNWITNITLLVYFFDSLTKRNIITQSSNINSFIENNFLWKNNIISNIKQTRYNIKYNTPKYSDKIDKLFD